MSIRLRFSASALAGAIALTAAVSAGPARAACQLLKVADWPVHLERGLPLIDGQVNGKPVRFVVALGANKSYLYSKAIQRLGLTVGPATFRGEVTGYGVGGTKVIGATHLDQLTLGGASKAGLDMFVWPGGGDAPDAPIGVVGQDFFTSFDIELDLAHAAVRLFKPDGCTGDQVVYWPDPYAVSDGDATGMILKVALNGSPTFARLSTGTVRSFVTSDAARRAGVTPSVSQAARNLPGVGVKPVQIQVAAFASFAIGQESIANVKLPVGDLFGADKQEVTGSRIAGDVIGQPEMLLGMDFLLAHRIYVAESQHKVYVSYIGGPVFAADNAPVQPH